MTWKLKTSLNQTEVDDWKQQEKVGKAAITEKLLFHQTQLCLDKITKEKTRQSLIHTQDIWHKFSHQKNTLLSFSLQFHFQRSKSWKTGSRETLPVLAPASATVVLFVCAHHLHAPVVWALFANVKVAERKIFVFCIQGWNSAGGSRCFPFVVVNTHTQQRARRQWLCQSTYHD